MDICFKPNKLVIGFLKSNLDSEKPRFNPVFMNPVINPKKVKIMDSLFLNDIIDMANVKEQINQELKDSIG